MQRIDLIAPAELVTLAKSSDSTEMATVVKSITFHPSFKYARSPTIRPSEQALTKTSNEKHAVKTTSHRYNAVESSGLIPG